jgi:penicillin amidase
LQRNLPDTWEAFEIGKPMFPVAIMPNDEIPAALRPNSRPSTLGQAPAPAPAEPLSPAAVTEAIHKLRHAFGHVGPVGSNNWAVDGRHTANGRPLIANDPHQPLQSPSLMYALHLNSVDRGGSIDVAGFAFAGTLGVQLGHNRTVQWAATTNFADVMDLWEVRVEDQGVWAGDTYVEWEPRTEVIAVAGAEPVTLELYDVPEYGVILPESLIPLPIAGAGRQLLVNWTGFTATGEERCFARMMRATNLEEWEAGVDHMEVGGFNFVGATADGISYRVNIRVPDRNVSSGALPYLVMDGDNADAYWTGGFLPPEQLPRSHADARGWIGTANNDPWGFTFDGDITNDPFYYGFFYAPGNRAKRIHDELERLAGQGGVTPDDMRALQTDTHSPMSDELLPVVAAAVAKIGSDPALAEFEGNADIETLAGLLADWDQRMERDSAGALAWHVWLHNMAWLAVQDDFGFLYTLVFEGNAPYILKIPALALLSQYSTPNLITENHDWIVVEALRMTAEWLNTRFGGVDPANYTWADMHGTEFTNPFGGDLYGGWTPTNGGEDTVNVSSSNFYADGSGAPAERFDSHDGAIFRVVTSFAEDGTPEATVNFPRGNSGEPSSPHFDDTLEDWTNGVYTPLPFRRAEVDAAAESSFTLAPEQFSEGS